MRLAAAGGPALQALLVSLSWRLHTGLAWVEVCKTGHACTGSLTVQMLKSDDNHVQSPRRRQVSRDKATNVARAMSNVSSAVIFGGIFWRMGRSQSSIQDRMGLLQARDRPARTTTRHAICCHIFYTCSCRVLVTRLTVCTLVMDGAL